MIDRVIRFKRTALLDPDTYRAKRADEIDPWEVGHDENEVHVHDSKKVDFPQLRSTLQKHGQSYDFYQRKDGDGDHAFWHHGRNGKEYYSNYGNSEEVIVELRKLAT